MKKLITNTALVLCTSILLFIEVSCSPLQVTPKTFNLWIGFLHNNQIHLTSIPRPCKRVDILTNGSVGVRNVVLITPTKEQIPIKVENSSFNFTPEIPGEYSVSYEYTYTNHFEHLEPDYNNSDLVWEKGDMPISVPNYSIPPGFEKVSSQNQLVTLYYPISVSSSIVDLVLECKVLQKPSIMTMDIKQWATFPQAYQFSGKQLIRIPLPLDRKHIQNGIAFELLDAGDRTKKIDTLTFKLDIPYIPSIQSEFNLDGEKPTDWMKHTVYYLENGDLKVWDFKINRAYILLTGHSFAFLALSPDRKYIALSTIEDTFLCDYMGKNFKKIGAGLIRPQFIGKDEIVMVASSNWNTEKSVTVKSVTISQNVYEMPIQIYQIQKSQLMESKILVNVYLGDRWSMYYPTFADIPTDILAFKRSENKYLFKLKYIGEDRWVSWDGKTTEEYTKKDVPWFPFQPYIFNEFAYAGDITKAILQKVTYNNGDDVLYVDPAYAELSLPDNQNRYLAFVRTVKDNLSAPSFYIETQSEICVYDKLTKQMMRLPVQTVQALKLGITTE